jgi:hypothetical protein
MGGGPDPIVPKPIRGTTISGMTRSNVSEARQTAGKAHLRFARSIAALAVAALAVLALLPPRTTSASGRTKIGTQAPLTQGRTTVGFWAGEAVPGTDWGSPNTYWNRRNTRAYTPYLWRVLRRNQIPLYFNLRYRRDFGPVPPGKPHRRDGLRIIRTANRLGVPVWGWVLIPYTDGYWAWEGAAAEQFNAVRALVRWTRRRRVRLRGLVLDPEPPVDTPYEHKAAVIRGGSDAAFPSLFQQTIDPNGQCLAWRAYARIPRWAKRHHVNLAAAPTPAVLDDLRDGHLALQDAAQFIVPKAPWHELFFQAYRSAFAYYSGHDPGPGVVPSYLRSARHEFGSVGQVSLGSAGRGRYRRLASLVHDVRLAATLGARDLPIYSLERTLRSYGGPRSLVRLVDAARHPFTGAKQAKATASTPQAKSLRAKIQSSDAAAVTATPTITAAHGASLAPNSWSNGCG